MTAPRRFDFPDHWVDADKAAWRDWFTRHGIDPWDVPVDGWVEADDEARTITYPALHRVAGERPHLASRCHADADSIGVCLVVAVAQLEGRAMPFPDLPRVRPA